MNIKLNLRTYKKGDFIGPFPVVIPNRLERGTYIHSGRKGYKRRGLSRLAEIFKEPVLVAIIPTNFKESKSFFSICTVKKLSEGSHIIQLIT